MKIAKVTTDIVLFSMMATVCVGTAELIFCYKEDPALYTKIMTPIVETFQGHEDKGEKVAGEIDALHAETTTNFFADTAASTSGVELASQRASDPSLSRVRIYAAPNVTTFVDGRDCDYLTNGMKRLVYYHQADERWAKAPFGTDTIDDYGCGPTAMCMIVSTLTDTMITPDVMALWAAEQGYASPGSGSFHSIVPDTCAKYGLNCESVGAVTAEQLCEKLKGGGLMVALVGEGHFTSSGHFIVLHGATSSGEILVADPNSLDNSLMTWDPQVIIDELYSANDSGAPLWYITKNA